MAKAITFLMLLLVLLCWAALLDGLPGLRSLLVVVSICGVALGMRCRRRLPGEAV